MGCDRSDNPLNYSLLNDLRLQIAPQQDDSFSLCFWVYLVNLAPLSTPILRQVHSDAMGSVPFLVIDEKKKMKLFPLLPPYTQDPKSSSSLVSWMEDQCVSSDFEFPLDKWVHVGCEVSKVFVRLHIDGNMVGEKRLSSPLNDGSNLNGFTGLMLAGTERDDVIHGYLHNVEVLSMASSIESHRHKDLPLKLSMDGSSTSEIEEDSDGVWCIVGGKASCRRIFSIDVTLLDTFEKPANKEMEVYASLLYDDNREPVEESQDVEPPLLAAYDGLEFVSSHRPSKLLHGRASFKLKISQLSSKCDNRLFCIRFDIPDIGKFPFFEAFTLPIRCISRTRGNSTRASPLMFKKISPNVQSANGSQSSGLDVGSSEFQNNVVCESRSGLPLKRGRLGEEIACGIFKAAPTIERNDEECSSRPWISNQGGPENPEAAENSPSDSESAEGRNLTFKCTSSGRNPISDLTIFKYCLGSLSERILLLNEMATSASDQELVGFAQQVSLYSGCSHHRRQIISAKRLIEEGIRVWNLISQNNHHVHWDDVVFEIEEQFMKIACCSTRSLTQQDFELLKRIAGCREVLARENFEKLWHWLYPVASAISQVFINALWVSLSPKWIEGFITKEEAEYSLQGPRSLQEPGTFILRFPTSRSWPHPDAGSLIVTYVGRDYVLHHRLLSLDFLYSSGLRDAHVKPLQDMLLADPELSRLGRIIRSH